MQADLVLAGPRVQCLDLQAADGDRLPHQHTLSIYDLKGLPPQRHTSSNRTIPDSATPWYELDKGSVYIGVLWGRGAAIPGFVSLHPGPSTSFVDTAGMFSDPPSTLFPV